MGALETVFVEISYAYPTSEYARSLKRSATGCWYTKRAHDGAMVAFSQLEHAFYSLTPGTEYSLDVGRLKIRGTVS